VGMDVDKQRAAQDLFDGVINFLRVHSNLSPLVRGCHSPPKLGGDALA
jgi:hypothetical protein